MLIALLHWRWKIILERAVLHDTSMPPLVHVSGAQPRLAMFMVNCALLMENCCDSWSIDRHLPNSYKSGTSLPNSLTDRRAERSADITLERKFDLIPISSDNTVRRDDCIIIFLRTKTQASFIFEQNFPFEGRINV